MNGAKNGDTVRLHYIGTLADGSVFDSSEGRDPLEFKLGAGQIIPGLEKAIPGLSVGDKQTVLVACDEAYGQADPDARQAIPRDQIPADIPVEIGTMLQMQTPDGRAMPVKVVELTETSVTLDANHPLAGQDLVFNIEVMEIV